MSIINKELVSPMNRNQTFQIGVLFGWVGGICTSLILLLLVH